VGYEIKSGEIPSPYSGRKYPFPDMKVGDYFTVPTKKESHCVRSSAFVYARRNPPKKFSIRRVGDEYRIWRIA